MLQPFQTIDAQITNMDTNLRQDIRDMAREAQIQTELLIQQGNLYNYIMCIKFTFDRTWGMSNVIL